MACFTAHVLRIQVSRVHYMQSRLLTSYSFRSKESTATYFVHSQKCWQLSHVLRNAQFGLISSLSIHIDSNLSFWRQFSSKHGQVMFSTSSRSLEHRPTTFMDTDKCLLIDNGNVEIAHLTFAEAQLFAHEQKCRLVYMTKNNKGIFCFKLQKLADVKETPTVNVRSEVDLIKSKPNVKPERNNKKEFRIRASISDHDLTIKLNSMRSLLVKGKQLMVAITISPKDEKTADTFHKKFTEDLNDIATVKKDPGSRSNVTNISIVPKQQV